jgi:hypothetical protein
MLHSRQKPSRLPAMDEQHIFHQNFGFHLLPAIVMAYFIALKTMSGLGFLIKNISPTGKNWNLKTRIY